jgi:chromosome partitioning protein
MSVPVLTFFNNKGGVGKTSLVFHLAWMFSEMGKRVVAIDLDPQANLTSAFLPEDALEKLWDVDNLTPRCNTIYQCIRPLTQVGDIQAPQTQAINSKLFLVPGDLGLVSFEDDLSRAWPDAMGSNNLYRPFRLLTAFWQVAQMAAKQHSADIILADVGPNLGAINRSALIGSDHVVTPLAADLFSLQGLRNLGPTLANWRADWNKRLNNWPTPEFDLPKGAMKAQGYILMQHSQRQDRPVQAYQKRADRIPITYRQSVLSLPIENPDETKDRGNAPECLAELKHYRSLMPMAQEVHKPIFKLTAAEGAIGSHTYAVQAAREDFTNLAKAILQRIEVDPTATPETAP